MPVPTDPYPNFVPLTTADADQVDLRFQRLYDTFDPAQVGIDVANLAQSLKNLLMPTGTIVATGCSTPPSSEYLMCDGAPVSRSTYANLWNAIRAGHAGTAGDPAPYGNGNGTSTFNVPDLRGRVAVGAGTGAGLTARSVGGLLGSEAANMPSHSHGGSTGTANLRHVHGPSGQNNMDFVGNSGAGAQFELSFLGTQSNQGVAWGGVTGGADVEMIHGHSITGAGGGNDNFGQPVNNLPPSQVVNYMIKV